jgi:PhnB protein
VSLHLYVKDVDASFRKATEAGAKPVRPVQDQFYGDRSGTLRDPFGHVWHLATHKEDLSPEEIDKRAAAMFKKEAKK